MNQLKNIYYICALWCTSTLMLHAQVTATVKQVQNGQGGSITLQITGGNAPFSFNWSYTEPTKGLTNTSYSTDQDIFDLKPGEYCVEVSDANCCTAEQCFTIREECKNIFVAYKKNESKCITDAKKGSEDGEVKIGIGLPFTEKDYDFAWAIQGFAAGHVFATTKDLNSMTSSYTYILTATNKINGCVETITVKLCCCDKGTNELVLLPNLCDIEENEPLKVTHTATPPTAGKSNGKIKLSTTGGGFGSTIYYQWTGPNGFTATTSTINYLPKGQYCYTVTDACQFQKDCIEIYACEEKPMTITETITKPCGYTALVNAGAIQLTIKGGLSPYKYKWSNGATTASLSNIGKGDYCVTVTDKGGCSTTKCIKVEERIYSYKREGCTDIHFCDGVEVARKDHGSFEEYDPWDCRYLNTYCKDKPNVPIKRVFKGTTFDPCNSSCTVNEYCPKGNIYKVHVGIPFEELDFNCNLVKGCKFPTLNDFCILSSVSKIKKTKIQFELWDDSLKKYIYGCQIESTCNGKTISIIFLDGFCPPGIDDENDEKFNEIVNQNQEGWYKGTFTTFDYENTEHINNVTNIVKNALNQMSTQNSSKDIQIKSIVPNPFQNSFTVTIHSEGEQKVTISVADLIGKEFGAREFLLTKELNTVEFEDMSEIPDGVYIVKVTDAKGQVATEKVIKQH